MVKKKGERGVKEGAVWLGNGGEMVSFVAFVLSCWLKVGVKQCLEC